jgi:hypothetical protein
MTDRILIRTGIAGTAITMLCCLTPVLTVLLGALGLATWLAHPGGFDPLRGNFGRVSG